MAETQKDLFIFAIGGTGSRVLKSLVFLLAAGVRIPNTRRIIPIIIDPDVSNGDKERTVRIIKDYCKIRKEGYQEGKSDFFYHEIASLQSMDGGEESPEEFAFNIGAIKGKKFKEFIGLSSLSRENQAMTRMLFSEKNLELDMEVGFKGNPNIGSIVLNQMKSEDFFLKFTDRVSAEKDQNRIFIISSIFGGTGASGFPILLKNLRYPDEKVKNREIVKSIPIGAISVLPYFKIDNPNGDIDSGTFISKTIAALKYYSSNIFDEKMLNAFYSIGDTQQTVQSGADGKAEQKNKAHFVEIASALAIHHFMKNNFPGHTHHEFACHQPQNNTIYFSNLCKNTKDIIAEPLTRFFLFHHYISRIYPEIEKDTKITHIHNGKLKPDDVRDTLLDHLKSFMGEFEKWLKENRDSSDSFQPFNLETASESLFSCVLGRDSEGSSRSGGFWGSLFGSSDKKEFIDKLNKKYEKFSGMSSPKKLMALLSEVTKDICENKIKP